MGCGLHLPQCADETPLFIAESDTPVQGQPASMRPLLPEAHTHHGHPHACVCHILLAVTQQPSLAVLC